MNLFTKVKPYIIAICVIFEALLTMLVGNHFKMSQVYALGVIFYVVMCMCAAYEFWKCQNNGAGTFSELFSGMMREATTTAVMGVILLALFGIMVMFYDMGNIDGFVQGTAFAIAIPVTLWLHVAGMKLVPKSATA